MKLIPLSQGKFAKVDDADYEFLIQFTWTASRVGSVFYAIRTLRGAHGRWTTQSMHALLAVTPPGLQTLHLNGDGLDNRRENLGIGTNADNQRGPCHYYGTSGFRGVSFSKPAKKYEARICHNRQSFYLGLFETAVEAAQVRDDKARELGWPEEGLNFPKLLNVIEL